MNVALLSQPQRELRAYLQRVAGDGGTVETPGEASTFVRRLRSAGVLGSTVIAGVAGGVKAGTLYSIIGPDLDVTRATVKNRVNRAGVLNQVASGVPATDYAGGVLRGTTVEPSAVNLAIRSQEFNTWSQTRVTVTQDSATAPDGTVTANKLIATTDANTHFLQRVVSGITTGATHTVSVFTKAGEYGFVRVEMGNNSAGAYFNLTNGTVVSQSGSAVGSIQPFEDGWYRCVVTVMSIATSFNYVVAPSPNGTSINYTGDGTSGIFIWGAQLETGSVATSYIKTEGSTQTRNADVITKTGLGSVLPQTEGWVYVEVDVRANKESVRVLQISDGTVNNRVQLAFNVNNFTPAVIAGGLAQAAFSAPFTPGINRCLILFRNNYAESYLNGVSIGTDSTVTVPVTTVLDLANSLGSNFLNDPIHSYAIGSGAITDAQAQSLTSL
jgi:hypothetical protein